MNEIKKPNKKPLLYYAAIAFLLLMIFNIFATPAIFRAQVKEVDYGTFMKMTEDKDIGLVEVNSREIVFTDKAQENFYKTGVMNDPELTSRLYSAGAEFSQEIVEQTSPLLIFLLTWVLPILLFVWIGGIFSRQLTKKAGGANSMMFNMGGRSNAKMYVKSADGIKFDDVAGEEEAKENLAEIVDYLHNPDKYKEIGANMPKGVLLVGPPGTGKTMLAKAVAGEANVPFFSMSGSEFVEMFVGMGASKVRDLFKQAKEKAPCIVFIDEIDAIGKKRQGNMSGNDEREQTLNQLLVEMDGFGANEGVIMIAATNRPDVLDPALLRPGRFDRQVYVGLPDIRGREAILKIHARDKQLAEDVDLNSIAKGTPGFAGADLENLMNEAALLAVRRRHRFINMEDIDEAILKVQMGPEKKSRKMSDKARRLTAYHEAGHAVAGRYLKHVDPVHYITIIPRGAAGGFTLFRPQEDLENFKSRAEMFENIVMALGGRVAEQLFLDDISTGASGDIQQASSIARDMVMRYGMSERLGPISYDSSGHSIFIGRDFGQTKSYSEETAGIIDEEVKAIFDKASEVCGQILTEHADQLRAIAEYLLQNETMEAEEFNYFFEHGEFMPISPKAARQARNDDTIEPPARKISMTDGYAEEKAAEAQTEAAPQTGSSATAQQPAPEADAEKTEEQNKE